MTPIIDQTVELFSGPKIFSSLAQALGYRTLTVDRDGASEPNIVADVRSLDTAVLPAKPLIVWAAPPDSAFNEPSLELHWDQYGTPLSPAAEEAMETFRATLTVLTAIQPKWWFIENPYGPLRHFTLMSGFNRGYPTRNRVTIDHADYGAVPSFRTDVWTNAFWWQPGKEAVSRIARRPVNAKVQPIAESGRRLPAPAVAEMLNQLDAYQRTVPSAYVSPELNG
jgi:hypothetical protein